MTRPSTPNILDNVLTLSGATPAPPAATKVAIKDIINDGGTQMRAGMNAEKVKEYEELLRDADGWPFDDPVVVYYDGAKYWLADGFHRLNAVYRSGKLQEIPAEIKAGTRRDAVLYACGANGRHGLPRTNDDKRRAVKTMLEDEEWAKWSDREIARRADVSNRFVSNLRQELSVNGSQMPTTRTVERNGQTYTQNTTNIGANRPPTEPAQRMSEQYEITPIVHGVVRQRNASAADLRMTARIRSGPIWQECLAAVPAGKWIAHRDLAQALNNVAYDMELRAANEAAKAAPVGHVSNVTEPAIENAAPPAAALPARPATTPLTVAEIVEELTPHLASFAPGNIAGAALGQQNDVTERCALVLSDFTYQQTDLRRALQRIANDRHLAMSKEASAPVANADRPLPDWAAEPEPATVEQTVADVVEVHGEPAPVAEPVEALPVSQRADYESDEWYTPAEYIEAARQVMGAIDLDPASSELAQTVVQAGVYLTRFDDGLSQVRWIHQRIWLNPPYSNPAPWIEKLVREHQAGPYCTEAIVLVNNATETSWFQLLLENFPVCLPARRLAFWRYDHNTGGARQGQAFFYLGPNADKFENVFKKFGPILRRVA